jgi:hypothetical protein
MKPSKNLYEDNSHLKIKSNLNFSVDDKLRNKSTNNKDFNQEKKETTNLEKIAENFEDKNILKEFKAKKKLEINNGKKAEYLNEYLMKVHRMSKKNQELAKNRQLRKNITEKPSRILGLVFIDRSRAEKMALNFFCKRLKSFRISRMNSEDKKETTYDFDNLKPNKNLNNIKLESKNDSFNMKEKLINKINNTKIKIGENEIFKDYKKKRTLTNEINQNMRELNFQQTPLGIRGNKYKRNIRLNLDTSDIKNNDIDNNDIDNNDNTNKNSNFHTIETNNNRRRKVISDNKMKNKKEVIVNKNNRNINNNEEKKNNKNDITNNKSINIPALNNIKINTNNNYYTNRRSTNHSIHSITDNKFNSTFSNTNNNKWVIKTNLNNSNNNTISYNENNKRTPSLALLPSLNQSNTSYRRATGRRSEDSIPVINYDKLKEEKEKEKEQKKRESLIRRQMLIGQINPELSKIVANAIIKVNKRNSTKNEIIDKKVEVKKDEKKNKIEKKEEKIKTEKDIKVRTGKRQMNNVENNHINHKKIENNENAIGKKNDTIDKNKNVKSAKRFYRRRENN